MKISLRPHHFLCIKGYKGLNYNEVQAANWKNVALLLKNNPQTDIFIMNGRDDVCKQCPSEIIKHKAYCKENVVSGLDNQVADFLGILSGKVYKYSEISEKLNKKMTLQKHKEFCSECCWWKKGLCKDSFEK